MNLEIIFRNKNQRIIANTLPSLINFNSNIRIFAAVLKIGILKRLFL